MGCLAGLRNRLANQLFLDLWGHINLDILVRANELGGGCMSEEQKLELINTLDILWAYGADMHPAPARQLNILRKALGLPEVEYRS